MEKMTTLELEIMKLGKKVGSCEVVLKAETSVNLL